MELDSGAKQTDSNTNTDNNAPQVGSISLSYALVPPQVLHNTSSATHPPFIS